MQTDELYRTRLERILKAVALETPDRVPVVVEYSGFAAYVTTPYELLCGSLSLMEFSMDLFDIPDRVVAAMYAVVAAASG